MKCNVEPEDAQIEHKKSDTKKSMHRQKCKFISDKLVELCSKFVKKNEIYCSRGMDSSLR